MFAFDRFIFTHAHTHTHTPRLKRKTNTGSQTHRQIQINLHIEKKSWKNSRKYAHNLSRYARWERARGGGRVGGWVGWVAWTLLLEEGQCSCRFSWGEKTFDFYLGPFSLNTLSKYWEDSLNIILIFSTNILHFRFCYVKTLCYIIFHVFTFVSLF